MDLGFLLFMIYIRKDCLPFHQAMNESACSKSVKYPGIVKYLQSRQILVRLSDVLHKIIIKAKRHSLLHGNVPLLTYT